MYAFRDIQVIGIYISLKELSFFELLKGLSINDRINGTL